MTWPAPAPDGYRPSLSPPEALVEGFYNLRAGYTKYEGFGWYLTGDNTHRNALYEAKRKADNERVEAASSAVKAVQRMRRKMDRLQAFFEDEARK